jgi:hypothetical protein
VALEATELETLGDISGGGKREKMERLSAAALYVHTKLLTGFRDEKLIFALMKQTVPASYQRRLSMHL